MLIKNEDNTLLWGFKHLSDEFTRVLSGQCHLLDSSKLIRTSEIDGMHLDPESHAVLGKEVAKYIRERNGICH